MMTSLIHRQRHQVSFERRQLAVKLARTLWDKGFDYSEAGFCPFASAPETTTKLKGPRPSWALFARVNENLETALVQEKFNDWSNIQREIGLRNQQQEEVAKEQKARDVATKLAIKPDMCAYDVTLMTSQPSIHRPLALEGV